MDIPNLSTNQPLSPVANSKFNPIILASIIIVALVVGFWLSRISSSNNSNSSGFSIKPQAKTESTDNISSAQQLEVGKLYGNPDSKFKDKATGTIEKGSINGEGTHILNRDGGSTQRASLISSAVDLDLFVGKKVEVKGETNASTKTSWLLDVGNIKIIQ